MATDKAAGVLSESESERKLVERLAVDATSICIIDIKALLTIIDRLTAAEQVRAIKTDDLSGLVQEIDARIQAKTECKIGDDEWLKISNALCAERGPASEWNLAGFDLLNALRLIENDERVDLHCRGTAEVARNKIGELQDDLLRRHNDAVDRWEALLQIKNVCDIGGTSRDAVEWVVNNWKSAEIRIARYDEPDDDE